MILIGTIKIDHRAYIVSTDYNKIQVELFNHGSKVYRAKRTYTKSEFTAFLDQLPLDISDLPKKIIELTM